MRQKSRKSRVLAEREQNLYWSGFKYRIGGSLAVSVVVRLFFSSSVEKANAWHTSKIGFFTQRGRMNTDKQRG